MGIFVPSLVVANRAALDADLRARLRSKAIWVMALRMKKAPVRWGLLWLCRAGTGEQPAANRLTS